MRRHIRFRTASVALVAFAFACLSVLAAAPQAAAQSVESFYRGKTINVIIGSSVGGGYDQYGRLLARYLGAHVPGRPELIPRNMPGASGRKALSYIYSVAPADGTHIGIVTRNTHFDPLLYGDKSIDVDPTKLVWLGSANSEVSTCVTWHTSGIASVEDAKKGMTIGASGPTSTDVLMSRILNRIAGTKMRVILGYPGSTEVHLAMERGEVTGRCGFGWDSIVSRYASWIEEKKINILVQLATKPHPDIPNVTFIFDLANNDLEREMLMVFAVPNQMGRPYFMRPGIPEDRLKALQAGFDAAMKDPALLEDAKRQNLAIDPMNGDEVAEHVRRVYQTSPEAMALVREILDSKDGLEQRKENYYTVDAVLRSVKKKGRELEFEDKGKQVRAMLTGSSKVTIGGADGNSAGLKEGMACTVTYEGHLSVAKTVACK